MAIFSAARKPRRPLLIRLSSSSSSSGRFAVELSARRLSAAESRRSSTHPSSEAFLSTVILSYGSARSLDRALSTFEQIPRLCSSPPSALSFNALLSSAIRAGHHARVPLLFSLLSQKHSISPDPLSYGILVKALCLSRQPDNALEAVKQMHDKGLEVTAVIYTTLINSLYREGRSERAEELWNEMKGKDLTAYNVRIMHGAFGGRLEEVLEVVAELRAAGLKPDRITYNYLMACYARNGRCEDVKRVYEELKSSGCAPNSTSFKVVVSVLCENGDFDAGFDVFKESVEGRKIPDFVTMRPLVVGLANNSKVEEARMVIREMMRERLPVEFEKELGLVVDGQASPAQVQIAES